MLKLFVFPVVRIAGRSPAEEFQAAAVAENASMAEAMVKAFDQRGVEVGWEGGPFYIKLTTEHAEPGVIAWNGPA